MAMAEKYLYEGTCVGGPMAGQQGQSRYPEGFLLVDRRPDKHQVWVYDYREEDDTFVAREGDTLDEERARKAANEPHYDVRAFDPEVME